jgi:abequosyltransferase
MILSICIPSFNRPHTLQRLLNSIDLDCKDDIEIVICEDFSSKRDQIRTVVNSFINSNEFNIIYIENLKNLGYDKNLRELIINASGEFIMFMGDDDYFITENLSKFIYFLKNNRNLGYILKSWVLLHNNGWLEPFNYYKSTTYFTPGAETYCSLFRISTFLSGFSFKRKYSLNYLVDNFDGTLLFQLYLLAEITINYPSAYYEVPITIQTKEKLDVPHFGSSEAEKKLYTPGKITIDNSINFLKGYFTISKFIDSKYHINSTLEIRKDLSRNSYSFFAIQRNTNLKQFFNYYQKLSREVKINQSLFFHIYFILLAIFGVKQCNKFIRMIKKISKMTPRL